MNRGKIVIVFIFGLATAMGAYAWWNAFNQGRRCLQLWGSDSAWLIRHAPRAELLILGTVPMEPSASASGHSLQIGDEPWPIEERHDIGKLGGIVHARHALIQDATYDWLAPSSAVSAPATWRFALRFLDGQRQATLVFDPTNGRVQLVETGQVGMLSRRMTAAFERKSQDWRKPPVFKR